jgi:hypothetical protein
MKILLTLAAAALTTAALSLPASAGAIGCDEGSPNGSYKATDCSASYQRDVQLFAPAPGASHSFAYAPRRASDRPARRSGY